MTRNRKDPDTSGGWPQGAPGSPYARAKGCTCAVMDNCNGKGRGMDGEKFGWYVSGNCPIHGQRGAA